MFNVATRTRTRRQRRPKSVVGSPHLLHLLLSLSTLTYLVTLHSFVVSPVSVQILFVRVVAQVQYSTPRRAHPHRSLRFFLLAWIVQQVAIVAMDVSWGSHGTKGSTGGWTQRGLVVDFIGQVSTPSRLHLVLLDVLIAALQLLTLLVSFAITLPSDLDASTETETETTTPPPRQPPRSGEAQRDYFGLLGLHERYDEPRDDEEDGDGDERGPVQEDDDEEDEPLDSRDASSYAPVQTRDDDDDDDDGRDQDFARPHEHEHEQATTTTTTTKRRRRTIMVRLEPIASLRVRHVWNEVKPGSFSTSFERQEERDLIAQEEAMFVPPSSSRSRDEGERGGGSDHSSPSSSSSSTRRRTPSPQRPRVE